MASKDDLRSSILELEPGNVLANSDSTSYNELRTELAAVKRRDKSRIKAQSVPVTAVYRHEEGETMSWKFCPADGDPIGALQYGDEIPMAGTVVKVDGVSVVVAKHKEGLGVLAIDLEVREKFDARRIYNTPNGTPVVFKRVESNRVVLWSYKIQSEIMIGAHVELARTAKRAKPVASRAKKMTQKILASYLISQNPAITPNELTTALQDAFPAMAVGQRHGPHYLSLSRNGRLPEPPDDDPRDW